MELEHLLIMHIVLCSSKRTLLTPYLLNYFCLLVDSQVWMPSWRVHALKEKDINNMVSKFVIVYCP